MERKLNACMVQVNTFVLNNPNLFSQTPNFITHLNKHFANYCLALDGAKFANGLVKRPYNSLRYFSKQYGFEKSSIKLEIGASEKLFSLMEPECSKHEKYTKEYLMAKVSMIAVKTSANFMLPLYAYENLLIIKWHIPEVLEEALGLSCSLKEGSCTAKVN